MRFGDLLEFRKDIFFDGAVQIDWFYNRDKATLVAKNFVFHGSEYNGAGGGRESNLKDTVSFVQEISEKVNNEFNNNPLSLAIATYGTGKSHLGVTLGELFSGPDYNPEAYSAIIENIRNIDFAKAREIEQNTKKHNLVLTINGMRDINLNAELLKVAQKSLLLYGCSTDNLKKINRALETASRFFERNCSSIGLFEKYASEFGFVQKGNELIEYVRATLFQEEATFNLVNAVYKDVNGVDISWDEGISANSILNALLDDYCGSSGPFDGIVILFDEFGRYLEYASNNNSAKTGESALQQIFECAQNAEGRIQVINFIQSDIKTYMQRIDPTSNISRYIGRYDASDKYHLSSNLETIFANLVLRKDKQFFTANIASRLQKKEEYWKDIYTSLNDWTNVKGVWKYYDKYRKVVVQGIFPMHPLATYALSQLSSYLQNRSSLFLVSQYFEALKDITIDANSELPCIYPEQLLQGDLFTEILSAEESGRQSTQFCLAFNRIISKHLDNLDDNCLKILRANLLLRILRFKTIDRKGAIKAISLFTGLSIAEINNSMDYLEREYAILSLNEHSGCFDFLEESTGAHDFKVFFNRARANAKLSKDILSDSIIRELADVIEPLTTRFNYENKIKTKEWQYEQDLFYVDELSAGYLNNIIKECSEAVSPDKPKGRLVWLYTNKDVDYSNIEDVVRLSAKAVGYPIVFMLLNDKDNRLWNAITDYVALKSFDYQAVNRFSAYYNEALDNISNLIRDMFENLKMEKTCIDSRGVSNLKDRLQVYLAQVFGNVYSQVLSFDFDGFENSRGKARSIFFKIVRILFNGNINNTTIEGLGVDGKGRLKNTLSYNAPNSWKCMSEDYLFFEPKNQRALSAYNLIMGKFVEDSYISYNDLVGELMEAPYGMNDHEALYLMAVVYANLSYCLRVSLNGVKITVGEWLDNVLPASGKGTIKIDFKKLSATSFVKKNIAGVEAKFLQLFNQIEASKDVDEVIERKGKIDELLAQEELPENLKDKYKLLEQKFNTANRLDSGWKQAIDALYEQYENLLDNKKSYDIQQGLKAIASLEKRELLSNVLSNGFIPSEAYKNELSKLAAMFRNVIAPLLIQWIDNERCTRREDITNFESKIKYFAKLLEDVGYSEENKHALEHIEKEKNKPFFKIEAVNSKFKQIETIFTQDTIDESYGYKRTSKLIQECKDLLLEIATIKTYLGNAVDLEIKVSKWLVIAKGIKAKLNEALDSLEEQLDNAKNLDDIRLTKYSIIKLQNNDYDAETEAYLKDLKGHLSSIIEGLEKIPGDIKNRNRFYETKSLVLQSIQQALDTLDEDYGHDLRVNVTEFFAAIEEKLDELDSNWRKEHIEFDFANASINDVNKLRLALDTLPDFLRQKTIDDVEIIRTKADEYIAQHRVNAVVEMFRHLNDKQRVDCYNMLKDLV